MAVYKIITCGRRHMKDAAALSERVFGSTFFRDNYMKEPGFKPSNIIMLYEKNRPASMACILPRVMRLDGLRIKLAGIGGVATAPEFRGKGYAAAVMKQALRLAGKRGFSLSLLYPYKRAYYEQFGYHGVTLPFRVIDTGLIKEPSCRYEIRKLNRPDYASLKHVYDPFNRGITGPVERPLGYWKNYCEYWVNQVKKSCWKEEPFICAYENKRMIAYIRVSSIRKGWGDKKYRLKISEFACLPGKDKAFLCLLYEARKLAGKRGFKKLFYDDAPGISVENSRRPSKNEAREYDNLKNLKMYRICSFKNLKQALKNLISRRLGRETCPAISRTGGVTLLSVKKPALRIKMKDPVFIRALLGLKAPGAVKLNRIIFPQLKPVFWDFDYL